MDENRERQIMEGLRRIIIRDCLRFLISIEKSPCFTLDGVEYNAIEEDPCTALSHSRSAQSGCEFGAVLYYIILDTTLRWS
jgi:hypothetical protein